MKRITPALILFLLVFCAFGGPGCADNVSLIVGSRCTLVFTAADTTKSCVMEEGFPSCEIHSVKLKLPNWTSNATATLFIKDAAGDAIYSQSAIAESTTTYIPMSRPIGAGYSIGVLLSVAAGGTGGTATVDVWVYK